MSSLAPRLAADAAHLILDHHAPGLYAADSGRLALFGKALERLPFEVLELLHATLAGYIMMGDEAICPGCGHVVAALPPEGAEGARFDRPCGCEAEPGPPINSATEQAPRMFLPTTALTIDGKTVTVPTELRFGAALAEGGTIAEEVRRTPLAPTKPRMHVTKVDTKDGFVYGHPTSICDSPKGCAAISPRLYSINLGRLRAGDSFLDDGITPSGRKVRCRVSVVETYRDGGATIKSRGILIRLRAEEVAEILATAGRRAFRNEKKVEKPQSAR